MTNGQIADAELKKQNDYASLLAATRGSAHPPRLDPINVYLISILEGRLKDLGYLSRFDAEGNRELDVMNKPQFNK